jgi:two-component system KDP operon response regulator KdpE
MSTVGRVLVVEDDIKIRNFICYSLQNEGLPYVTASTGQGALSLLVSETDRPMLLDLGLPDFDGIEVIKKYGNVPNTDYCRFPARDQDKRKALALDQGADDYLTKPFSATEN